MRASPPLLVSLKSFALWRGAVLALVALAVATLLAWLVLMPQAAEPALRGSVAAGLVAIAAAGSWLWSRPTRPVDLRWDGTRWTLAPARAEALQARAGQVVVAIDLGAWMLLRFVADDPAERPAVRWLPAEARALRAHWHALRCAVYSPQCVPGTAAPQETGR